ncbi:uncharacterized protein [Cicer arietinum]|uniref:uncharacterized protein isoform X2 n=1 Tax=Cicer arietinum TaxID=3827 RepID=UPI003CC56FE1
MSWLLRSTKTKLLSSSSSLSRTFSSIPRSTNQIEPLSPVAAQLFHPTTSTLPTADENPTKRYQAFGLDTNVLAGARYATIARAAKSPMLSGLNALMARNSERSVGADPLGLAVQRRFMSDIPSKTSETKPSGFRPLSPHLPVYQPQLSSTLSIINRISGAFLSAVVLLFYMIYMKTGLVSLTYDSFYQFVFYSSKLNLLALEISALAMSYHLYSAIRHLFI